MENPAIESLNPLQGELTDYEPTLQEEVLEWMWSMYPQLYNEREEHFSEVRYIIINFLAERGTSDIEAHSPTLQKMLEKRFYFLGD